MIRAVDEPRWFAIGEIRGKRCPVVVIFQAASRTPVLSLYMGVASMRRKMKATAFDREFEAGDSIVGQLHLSKARRPGLEIKRITVGLPTWIVQSLDREARRVGVTRRCLIRQWLAERLDQTS